MIKAKDCLRWLVPSMVTCLGLGLSMLAAGCSSLSGLRSVGAERPSLLNFWERPAGTPTPENDSYVQSMRAGEARSAEIASHKDDSNSGSVDGKEDGEDKLADGSDTVAPRRRRAPKTSAGADDDTVRVSLGRPEPLPGVGLAVASSGKPASTAGTNSQWKADKEASTADTVADRADARDRSETVEAEPARPEPKQRSVAKADWKAILSRAESRLESMQTYQMRVSRLERVGGQIQPEEDILLSVRREPKAVRLEWASGPSKGREVIYSSALDPRMIFVHMPSTAIPLPVMKIPVDSPLVMRNSRHAITEAGLDTIVENLRKSERGVDAAPTNRGGLSYKGIEKPSGLDRTCHHFVRKTANGETWNVYLDELTLLPSMVVAQDSRGAMIERYIYRAIQENPADLAAAGAFEPDQRWGESKGLLGRLARAAAGTNLPASDSSTTR
jgi:Protein of unknown function (DUF1571)